MGTTSERPLIGGRELDKRGQEGFTPLRTWNPWRKNEYVNNAITERTLNKFVPRPKCTERILPRNRGREKGNVDWRITIKKRKKLESSDSGSGKIAPKKKRNESAKKHGKNLKTQRQQQQRDHFKKYYQKHRVQILDRQRQYRAKKVWKKRLSQFEPLHVLADFCNREWLQTAIGMCSGGNSNTLASGEPGAKTSDTAKGKENR